MIKVLHFVSVMNRAGQETFLMNVFRNIDREKFTFDFLCTRREKGDYDEEIERLGGRIFYVERSRKKGRISSYLQNTKFLTKWLKDHRGEYDIVHLHTYHNMDVLKHVKAAKRAGVKIVVHSHNSSGPHPVLHRFLRGFCNMYPHEKLACSYAAGEWLYGKKGKFTVINNGIELKNFAFDGRVRDEYRTALSLEGCTVLGHIGRFNEQKNHGFLLDIFSEYSKLNPASKLVLVGGGALEESIKSKAENLKLSDKILFLGVRDDVEKLLNAFDCFVFPSLYEGLSVVAVEAQANGLKIFMSDTISPETFLNGNVSVLPLGNAKEWAEKIYEADNKRTDELNVEKFDISFTVKQLEEIYTNLANG